MNEIEIRIERAKREIIRANPFVASILLRCKIVMDATTPTAWTDFKRIGLNPAFIAGIPEEQVKTVLAHETLHIAYLHNFRRGDRTPRRWNEATDHRINSQLTREKYPAIDGWLRDRAYADMSEEQIYAALPPDPTGGKGGGGKGKGKGKGGTGQGPGPGGTSENLDPTKGGRYIGEVRDATENPDVKPGEAAKAAAELTAEVSQAEAVAAAAGHAAGNMRRSIRDARRGRVDWRAVLRTWIAEDDRSDYDWTVPDRRYVHHGIIMPDLHAETLPPLALIVDTSGSINADALGRFIAEIDAIRAEYGGQRLVVIPCDTRVYPDRVLDLPPLMPYPKEHDLGGGGGTLSAPAFDYLAETYPEIGRAVYYTDAQLGDFGRYTTPAALRLIWATIDGGGRYAEKLREIGGRVLDLDAGGFVY